MIRSLLLTGAAALFLVAGCMNFEYVGREFAPTPMSEPVAYYVNREQLPPGEFRIMGRAEITAPDGTDGYDIQELLLEKARSYGADAVCLVSARKVPVGYYEREEVNQGPQFPLDPANVGFSGAPEPLAAELAEFGRPQTLSSAEGTRLEVEVKALFLKKKAELERRLERIKEGKSQIMLGTQMLAKGHDFPDVTLVGILDIDSGLFSDDFRALESTAQLLTQVSGRAGRAQKQGEVIIQSYHPENELLNRLITPNTAYFDIALDLLLIRKNLSLPPFSYQAFLLSNSEDRVKAFAYLQDLNSCLIKKAESYEGLSLGPVISDKMEKRHNRYHFHILVTALRRDVLNAFLNETVKIEQDNPPKNDVRFAIEVDPLFLY